MIHSREAERRTRCRARGVRRHRRPPLLLVARACSTPALERGYYVSFAGNVDVPEGRRSCATRPRAVPTDRILVETDSPYLAPQPVRGRRERAGARRPHARGARRRPRRGAEHELAARIDANAPPPSACRERSTPKKSLGQHFLVDENILGVIGRLAALGADDVVLEIGPGLGVLTALPRRPRRARARGRARPLARGPLRDGARRHGQRRLDLRRRARARPRRRSSPAPTKLVANLPYNVATPLVVETLDGMPVARALVRDGAARGRRPLLRRRRGRRRTARCRCSCSSDDAASVGFHPVAPTVFRPRPRVDSALVAFERVDGPSARRACGASSRRVRPPAQDARQLARARRPRDASGGRGRARGDRHAGRTCAPRRSRRTSSSRSRRPCG